MGKYNQIIDIEAHSSVSHILKNIQPYSIVLEFGSSSGYMTKYMKEVLSCQVDIIEISQEDGLEASQYANQALIGLIEGDIEKYMWVDWVDYKFDYIVFSDVLEHLNNPWQVLKIASSLLKETGSVIISVPNISHNSVIVDLINNKFDYRDLGLLDNTHLRFFTRSSLLKMVEGTGLYVEKEMNTYCAVEDTEFKNTLEDVPNEVAEVLKQRDDGILYQFVWKLKKRQV